MELAIRTNGTSQLFTCRSNNQGARMRLLCFPCAGSNDSFFPQDFSARLAASDIEMHTLKLPGRGLDAGHEDSPYVLVENLIDDIVRDVNANFSDKPFCFLGHSFGTMLAFFVTKKLSEDYSLKPESLFLSSTPAPQSAHREELNRNVKRILQSNEEATKFLLDNGAQIDKNLQAEPEFMEEIFIKPLRQDCHLGLQFSSVLDSRQGPWLSCPIHFYYGDEDIDHDLEAWRAVSSGGFNETQMKGNHHCILEPENYETILRDIEMVLKRENHDK